MKNFSILFIVLVITLNFSANAQSVTNELSNNVSVERVDFAQKAVTMEIGSSLSLVDQLNIFPENANDYTTHWFCDNIAVASVDNDGTLCANAAGEANITVVCDGKMSVLHLCVLAPAAVEELEAETLYIDECDVVYNIWGQQVDPSYTGIVILRDGRKVVLRRKPVKKDEEKKY